MVQWYNSLHVSVYRMVEVVVQYMSTNIPALVDRGWRHT